MKKKLNVELEQKNEELMKIHKRDIFNIVENNQNDKPNFMVTLGMYKIKEFESLELADLYLMERPNELIFAMIGIAVETALKEFNNNKN